MSIRAFEGWTGRVNYAQAHALVDRALWGSDLMRRRAAHRTIDAAALNGNVLEVVFDGRNMRIFASEQRVTPVAVLRAPETQRFITEQKIEVKEGAQ